MTCELVNYNPVFTINLVKRSSTTKYAFIGEIEDKTIYNKIEKRVVLSSTEMKHIISIYRIDICHSWVGKTGKPLKEAIKFIYDSIYINDTINILRFKISHYLKTSSYNIIPDNQHLWYQCEDSKYKLLGVYHKKEYLFIDQLTSKSITLDKSLYKIVKDEVIKTKPQLYNNLNYILRDVIVNIKPSYNIYVSNLTDELTFLVKKKTKLTQQILYGYISKYWPLHKNKGHTKNEDSNISRYVTSQRDIAKLLNTPYNNIISTPYVLNCILHIKQKDVIFDMFKVLTICREHLSNDLPFIRFKYIDWVKSKFFIYSNLPNKIDKYTLKTWYTTSELDIYNKNNINLKIFTYMFNKVNYYTDCTIKQNGSINIAFTYLEDYRASFDDISRVINYIGGIIKVINSRLSYNLEVPYFKINSLDYNNIKGGANHNKTYINNSGTSSNNTSSNSKNGVSSNSKNGVSSNSKNGVSKTYINNSGTSSNMSESCNLAISNNIDILYLQLLLFYHNKDQVILDDIYNFSDKFNQYIIKKKDSTQLRIFDMKYKKVSNFINMTDICDKVLTYKKNKLDESIIISKIMNEFSIDYTTAQNKVDECISSSRFNKYSNGINIEINTLNKIKISSRLDSSILFNMIDSIGFISRFMALFFSSYKNNILNKINILNNTNLIQDIDSGNISGNISGNNSFSDYSDIDNSYQSVSANSYSNTGVSAIAPDSAIEKSLLMTCKDKIPELDVCADICEDDRYKLRRLQRYDNELFKYKTPKSSTLKQYAKKCGSNLYKQPIVLKYNPDKNTNIDRDSYTYALYYRDHYYICPLIWDAYSEYPINIKHVTNIENKATIHKGKCLIGDGPYGKKVLINQSYSDYKLGKIAPIYPGVFPNNEHPAGLYMPCCHYKDQRKKQVYKECIGDESSNLNEKKHSNYIFNAYKSPLPHSRYGLIPVLISKLLHITNKLSNINYLLPDTTYYLRKGVNNTKTKSIIHCMFSVFNSILKISTTSYNKLRNIILNKLESSKTLYKSLSGGMIARSFKATQDKTGLQRYVDYIFDETSEINIHFVWDLFSRKGIISSDGLNIIVITNDKIVCPMGVDINKYYNNEQKCIILYTSNITNSFYEPIFKVSLNVGQIRDTCLFDINSKFIQNIILNIKHKCIKDSNIDYQKVMGKINIISLDDIKKLDLDANYRIKTYIYDAYYKIYMVQLNNNLVLPTTPTGIDPDYPLSILTDINLLNYTNSIKLIKPVMDKLGIDESYLMKIVEDKTITALYLYNYIIPIKPSPNIKDSVEIKKYMGYSVNVNRDITTNTKLHNNRTININKIIFEEESYIRYRFTISRYLAEHKNIKTHIKDIILSDDTLQQKRIKMMVIITKLTKELVHINTGNIDEIITNYKRPNKRIPCFIQKNNKDPHCICGHHKSKCKLFVNKVNLISNKNNIEIYKSKISDELIRIRIKGDEILKNTISDTIDKSIIEPLVNEVIYDIGDDILDIYKNSIKYHSNITNNINMISTTNVNFNKNKFKIIKNSSIYKILDKEMLSNHWKKILKDDYSIIFRATYKYTSIYPLITMLLPELNPSIPASDIKHQIINKLSNNAKSNNAKSNNAKSNNAKGNNAKGNNAKSNNAKGNNVSINLLIQLFKDELITHKDAKISDIRSEVEKDNYNGSIIDLPLIAKLFNINILVLHSRITKVNPQAFNLFLSKTPSLTGFLMLYSYKEKGTKYKSYSIIHIKGSSDTFLYLKEDIPKQLSKYIMSNNSSNVSNENIH
jgi:hypothetical protein